MAATKVVLSHFLTVLSSAAVLLSSHVSALDGNESKDLKICGFDAIYNFGDSLSDTGNAIAESLAKNSTAIQSPRELNALDSIVNSAGFSSIRAYLDPNQADSNNGVNFAYSGATALSFEVVRYKLNNVNPLYFSKNLNTQLQWLDKYLKVFCQKPEDCKEKLKSSLFIMGEIGVNDCSQAFFFSRKTVEQVKKMGLPFEIVKTIEKAIEKVIDYGAARVLVPGIFPAGCAPGYVKALKNSSTLIDKFGCANEFNDFFKYHNELLQATLENLRKKYPGVSIVYGDYYNAMQFVLDNYQKLGFEYVTKPCDLCTPPQKCPCSDPKKYIFQDIIHPTQNSAKHMANWLTQDIISKFGCK